MKEEEGEGEAPPVLESGGRRFPFVLALGGGKEAEGGRGRERRGDLRSLSVLAGLVSERGGGGGAFGFGKERRREGGKVGWQVIQGPDDPLF